METAWAACEVALAAAAAVAVVPAVGREAEAGDVSQPECGVEAGAAREIPGVG